jgi:hypothetical protein
MAINRGARASSHPTQAISWQLSPPPHTHPLHVPHKHTLAQGSFSRSSIVRPPVLSCSFVRLIVHGSFVRSSDRSIVRPFVRPNNLFPVVMLPKFRLFVRPIVHGSFVRSSDRSIVRPFVRPNNLFPAVMLPKFRSSVRSIDRSSFVHSSYSSFIVRSSSLFTVTIYRHYSTVTIYRYYLPSLFYRYYLPSLFYRYYLPLLFYRHYLPLLFTVTIYCYYLPLLFTVTIYRYYLPLLFIDHPITPNFNYSSIMLSSPPKTSQTHIPVIQTPVSVIFLPVGTSHLVTHSRFLQVEHA